MSKQHGMLFKAEMVNKVRDKVAPKTQTRRPITFSNSICTPRVRRDEWHELRWAEAKLMSVTFPVLEKGGFGELSLPCWLVPFRDIVVRVYPRIRPGDVIWVKETVWIDKREPKELVIYAQDPRFYKYKRDGVINRCWHDNAINKTPLTLEEAQHAVESNKHWKRKSSMLMHRWASRIDLLVLAMRSERVQEISEDDVRAEGRPYNHRNSPKVWFMDLWDSINTDRGFPWAGNHPVWIHDFKEVEG